MHRSLDFDVQTKKRFFIRVDYTAGITYYDFNDIYRMIDGYNIIVDTATSSVQGHTEYYKITRDLFVKSNNLKIVFAVFMKFL